MAFGKQLGVFRALAFGLSRLKTFGTNEKHLLNPNQEFRDPAGPSSSMFWRYFYGLGENSLHAGAGVCCCPRNGRRIPGPSTHSMYANPEWSKLVTQSRIAPAVCVHPSLLAIVLASRVCLSLRRCAANGNLMSSWWNWNQVEKRELGLVSTTLF
jgi:hypothetical protein